ncbi:MAG: ZIP family metal transporter [Sphingobacteriales bacterium]|jgi:zinc and cadmium transporter|nr:ZIP family metal transporter [Sphingobacteriales bacterium]
MNVVIIITALFLASIGCLAIAGLMLLLKDEKLNNVSPYFLYVASGILLGAAFLGMIPKAVAMVEPVKITSFILIGILSLFTLEKIVLWRNCGNKDCERHSNASSSVALIGDAFHHIIDGIVITSSFLISIEVGVMVSISIAFHEIPKSMGDLSILIKNGLSRKRAFWYKVFSVSTALIFGTLAFFLSGSLKTIVPYVLAFSAASFLYLSLAQLIPEMHSKTKLSDSISQIMLILLGIAIIYVSLHLK